MIDKLSVRAQMDAEHPDAVLVDLEAKSQAGQSLARLARGKPKRYSAAELALRSKRLAQARIKRWQGHTNTKKPS